MVSDGPLAPRRTAQDHLNPKAETREYMADSIRFAHIGVAYPHGLDYMESLLLMHEVEVVALYDPDPGAAGNLVPPGLRGLPLYDDLADLLTKERPEAVLITQPNDVTPQFMVQAAEAGGHVFAEKPCARTAAEFVPAVQAIQKSGVQFATGYTRRVSPAGRAVKEIVDRGVPGRLVSVEASWVTTSVRLRDPAHPMFSDERCGGGILHWQGCHCAGLHALVDLFRGYGGGGDCGHAQRGAHRRRGYRCSVAPL